MQMLFSAEPGKRGNAIGIRMGSDGIADIELLDTTAKPITVLATASVQLEGSPADGPPRRQPAGAATREFTVFGYWQAGEPIPTHVLRGYHNPRQVTSAYNVEGPWAQPVDAGSFEEAETQAVHQMRSVRAEANDPPYDPQLRVQPGFWNQQPPQGGYHHGPGPSDRMPNGADATAAA